MLCAPTARSGRTTCPNPLNHPTTSSPAAPLHWLGIHGVRDSSVRRQTLDGGALSVALATVRSRIMYVESKASGLTGEARIGRVSFSKTGWTLYCQGARVPKPEGRWRAQCELLRRRDWRRVLDLLSERGRVRPALRRGRLSRSTTTLATSIGLRFAATLGVRSRRWPPLTGRPQCAGPAACAEGRRCSPEDTSRCRGRCFAVNRAGCSQGCSRQR
jgi:hypothetical protein